MYCASHNKYTNDNIKEYSIQIKPGMMNSILTPYYTELDREVDSIYFSLFMLYVIFPLLYIIFTTGSLNAIMTLWSIVQTGVFDAIQGVKQFLMNTVIFTLRVFGCYTFSTYTVVKNGRELFSSRSEYFFMKSTRANIKSIDPAKYRICKWIDNECDIYRRENDGDEPELTDTHNDIYDFILHTFDDYTSTRIHRGDFRISTHTSLADNYRKFCKSYQICDTVELRVSVGDTNVTEVIFIHLKGLNNFYIEKNVILDKKFLRWYLYNKLGRKDVADYIGLPYSTYEVHVYYENFMKDAGVCVKPEPSRVLAAIAEATGTSVSAQRIRAFTVNDGQYLLIGNRYIVKVDSILGCPVFESVDKDVFHIDDVLTNYYENSVCEYTDDDESEGECGDNESDNDSDNDDNDNDSDDESAVTDYTDEIIDNADATTETTETETETPDTEFEFLEPTTD